MKRITSFLLALVAVAAIAAPQPTHAEVLTTANLKNLTFGSNYLNSLVKPRLVAFEAGLVGLTGMLPLIGGTMTGALVFAPTAALPVAITLTDSDIGDALSLGANPIIATDFRANATLSAQLNVSAAASTWSGIDVTANLDAEDVMLRTTGTEGDLLLISADDIEVNVAAGAIINIGDNAVAKTIDIGGVSADGADIFSICTNATSADVIAIGNAHTGTTINLEAGTASNAIQIGNGATVHGVQIASNAAADNDIAIGGANSGSTVTIEAGTAAAGVQIANGTTAHGVQIASNATAANAVLLGGANAGSTLSIESGTAAGSLAIGNGATAHGIQIGTNATAVQTVSVGSANVGSTLSLVSGTAWSIDGTGSLTTTAGTASLANIVTNSTGAAGAADYFILSAGADKTVKAHTFGPSSILPLSGGTMTGYLTHESGVESDGDSDDSITINKQSGIVTTKSLVAVAAGTIYTLTLVNSRCVSSATPLLTGHTGGTNTKKALIVGAACGTGNATINILNIEAVDALDGTFGVSFFIP